MTMIVIMISILYSLYLKKINK